LSNKCQYIVLQPEPFFLSFALYNAKEGCKISEDFHFDPNSPEIRSMIPSELIRANSVSINGANRPTSEQTSAGPDPVWLELQKQVIMT
jgi:hypothetical protein